MLNRNRNSKAWKTKIRNLINNISALEITISQYMEESTRKIMIEEAARFNTTVENLEESGFFFSSDACGKCHWFAFINGTMMSLAWFRERQRKLREQYK